MIWWLLKVRILFPQSKLSTQNDVSCPLHVKWYSRKRRNYSKLLVLKVIVQTIAVLKWQHSWLWQLANDFEDVCLVFALLSCVGGWDRSKRPCDSLTLLLIFLSFSDETLIFRLPKSIGILDSRFRKMSNNGSTSRLKRFLSFQKSKINLLYGTKKINEELK